VALDAANVRGLGMARDPRLTALRRSLLTRQAGWWLAVALALLGWHRLTRAAGLVGHALAQAARLVLEAGWICCCWPRLASFSAWPSAAPVVGPPSAGYGPGGRLGSRCRGRGPAAGGAAVSQIRSSDPGCRGEDLLKPGA
jgi:hypothetical protein